LLRQQRNATRAALLLSLARRIAAERRFGFQLVTPEPPCRMTALELNPEPPDCLIDVGV